MPANGTTGSITVTAPDNVYTGANDPVIKSIASVDGPDVGKFEQLTLDKTPVSTTVTTSQVLRATKATWSRSPSRRPDFGGRERQTDLHRAHQPAAGITTWS
ncbi:immunoglobulin-like domain-containing protein [Pseudomonas monteilii]|uniref:immunoglobulin-like domain-containing protein n=1 Tax=Pseudomonas monteilii TaxID=76759 RepID=UPI001F22D25E|nr:immunoglobulin-like domain-containing protein [Pseudomonas monteilii]